jgi:hypothetical protein
VYDKLHQPGGERIDLLAWPAEIQMNVVEGVGRPERFANRVAGASLDAHATQLPASS